MSKNKPLSPTMQKVLDSMKIGEPVTAYDIGASLSTLNALARRGYVTRKAAMGSSWFPHNLIIYTRRI